MSMYIVSIAVVFLEVLTNDLFLQTFFNERQVRTPVWKVLRIVGAWILLVWWVRAFRWSLLIKLAGVILIFSFYTVLFFRAHWFQGMCFSVFILSVALGMEAIALFVCLPFFPEGIQPRVFLPLELFIKVVTLVLIMIARHIWLKENEQRLIPKNLIIPLLSNGMLFFLTLFCVDRIQRKFELVQILNPVIAGVLVLNICSFFYFTVIVRRENALQEMDRLNRKREMELEIYRSKKEWSERQARRLHDYKNQLMVISRMLEADSCEHVQAYIRELTGSLVKEMDCINTNHSAINAVLNIKCREAEEKGISLNVQCSDLSRVAVDEADIVVLLCNLLDNAIEACECEEDNYYIQFKMILEERQLLISTKNRSQNSLSREAGRFASTKKGDGGHGIGTVNIEAIAKKYGGIFVLSREKEYVKAVVILPA